MAFFLRVKNYLCQKDTAENPLKIQVLKKNQNFHSKKKGNLKEKNRKKVINSN